LWEYEGSSMKKFFLFCCLVIAALVTLHCTVSNKSSGGDRVMMWGWMRLMSEPVKGENNSWQVLFRREEEERLWLVNDNKKNGKEETAFVDPKLDCRNWKVGDHVFVETTQDINGKGKNKVTHHR